MTDELKLRELLACAYAGTYLYTDDGELQDNRTSPQIDFLRDPVDRIAEKIQTRAQNAIDAASGVEKILSDAERHREIGRIVEQLLNYGVHIEQIWCDKSYSVTTTQRLPPLAVRSKDVLAALRDLAGKVNAK